MARRAAFVVIPLVIALVGGCSSEPKPAPTGSLPSPTPSSKAIQGGPDCKLPDERPSPKWLPDDIPLPEGTYFYKPLPDKKGLHRGRFVIRLNAEEFREFVKTEWAKAGISLGRQDSEPGETEALFRTSGGFGIFKANDVICDPPYATLLLISG